jgi:O-acetyl-ADP-ribose deacetylase (regulator of RNase III)
VITYLKGDATQPQGPEGLKIIAHICNNIGGWGRGFVISLSNRWSEPEIEYRKWSKQDTFKLGAVQYVRVEPLLYVANMIAQEGYGKESKPPIRYPALRNCLASLERQASRHKASIHMPRIGCGLAGGDWTEVEKLIQEKLGNLQVFVYDLS